MNMILRTAALTILLAQAPAGPAWAQQGRVTPAPAPAAPASAPAMRAAPVDLDTLYRDAWSAEEMIGTEVRGDNGQAIGEVKDIVVDRFGNVSHVIVASGGFYGLGHPRISIPWRDLTFGTDLGWLQVPLREMAAGTDAMVDPSSWRVNELIGDVARLRDAPRFGTIADVIFDNRGQTQALVVRRAEGPWGAAGTYAYPFDGYFAREVAYPLPFGSTELARFGPFDYARLGELSQYSGADRRAAAVGASSRR